MILTKEQTDAFVEAARPLIKWLNENGHPHVRAIVELDGAALTEGICSRTVADYIKD
jgi:hypothetical protein